MSAASRLIPGNSFVAKACGSPIFVYDRSDIHREANKLLQLSYLAPLCSPERIQRELHYIAERAGTPYATMT